MSDAQYADFQSRLFEIERNHKRRNLGLVRLEERDGMLVPVGIRTRRRRELPLRGIALGLASFVLLKGLMLAYLGTVTYTGRVAALDEGPLIGKLVGWAMQADPVTLWIAAQVHMLL